MMNKRNLLLVVCLALSCSTPSQLIKISATPTITVTATVTPSPTPAATYTPVFTSTPQPLTEDLTSKCDRAFDQQIETGNVELPILPLIKKAGEEQGWRPYMAYPHIQTQSISEARTLVCIRINRSRAFSYTDGSSAYRLYRDERVINLADGRVIFGKSDISAEPPSVKIGSGDQEGDLPLSQMDDWLYAQVNDRGIIRDTTDQTFVTAALSPDGSMLAIGNVNGSIRLLDMSTREQIRAWDGYGQSISKLEFSPDGQTLLSTTSSPYMTTSLWEVASGNELYAWKGDRAAFTPDGKNIATVAEDPEQIIDAISIWDLSSRQEVKRISNVFAFPFITTLDFSADGNFIAVTSIEVATVHIVDISDPTNITTMKDESREDGVIEIVAFSPDNHILASSDHKGIITIWDVSSGQKVRELGPFGTTPIAPNISEMAFSADGRYLAAGVNDFTVRVWDTATWLEIHTLLGHTGQINGLGFSSDGTMLVSASTDRTIRIWDITLSNQ